MVYATCSILPSENNEQVENFLKNNPDFKLVKEEKYCQVQVLTDFIWR